MPATPDTFSGTHVNSVSEAVNATDINTLQDGLRYTEGVVLGPLVYNVKHQAFGAVGDGTTDDAAAINAALSAANTAGGGIVALPAGTYIIGASLTIYSKVKLIGAGIEATIIKLKNASNVDMLVSSGFAGLTGGNTTGGIYNFSIEDMTIDGNKTNQTAASSGIKIYGYGYIIRNLRVRNCFIDGIYSEWSDNSASPGYDAMESQWTNVKVHDCINRGINFHGPHDSQLTNIITYLCHRPFHIEPGGSAAGCQVTNLHSWLCTAGGDYAVVLGNGFGCVTNLLAEGGITAEVLILSGNIVGYGWQLFATPTNSVVGIVFGDATHGVAGLQISASIFECQGGSVTFTNELGSSMIEVMCYISAGWYVNGTPAATTKFKQMQAGSGGGNYIETSGIGQSWTLESTGFSQAINFNSSGKRLEMLNGATLRFFSDAWGTQKAQLDGSTGELNVGNFSDASQASATVLATGGTITPVIGIGAYRMAPTVAVTGIILATLSGHDATEIEIYNESAFLITFAAVGTSHVANGVTATIPVNSCKRFKWNNAKNLWYVS